MSANFFIMIFMIVAFFVIAYFKKNSAPLEKTTKKKPSPTPLNSIRIVNIQMSTKESSKLISQS